MDKNAILAKIQTFIESKQGGADKKTQALLAALRRVRAEMLMIGEEPTYFCARMECNSTGVGESYYEGTKTQRTVSLDYVTDTYLFIDGDLNAGKGGLEIFYLKEGQTLSFYAKDAMERCATLEGFQRHSQSFRDLNFSLTDHRLNRFTPIVTTDPFTYPIRPIVAFLSDKGEKLLIGYVVEKDGEEYILIEPEEIKKPSLLGFEFKPWMLIFLFIPLFWVAIPFILYGKYKCRQMTGL